MKKNQWMKKIGFLVLLLCILQPLSIYAGKSELDLERDRPTPAKVVEVIDSHLYKLLVYDRSVPQVSTFSLIGILPNSNQQAYDYSVKKLLHQVVYFLEDSSVPSEDGIRPCYLYLDFHLSHNDDLLQRGFAELDSKAKSAKEFLRLKQSQNLAKETGKGIFDYSLYQSNDNIININTASVEQLAYHFSVSKEQAGQWYARISSNPINHIGELRALDIKFFTPEVILHFQPTIHLKTDLSSALPYELVSLSGRILSNHQITDEILNYRLWQPLKTKADFDKLNLMEIHKKQLLPYLAFENDVFSFISQNDRKINIHTAGMEQLAVGLGISASRAAVLSGYADRYHYFYRNKDELMQPSNPLEKESLNSSALKEKLSFFTEINTAGDVELESLFGRLYSSNDSIKAIVKKIKAKRPFQRASDFEKVIGKHDYAKIKPYIYLNSRKEVPLINLNTAGKDFIASQLKLSLYQKNRLQASYQAPSQVPEFMHQFRDRYCLYTNMNTADLEELQVLHPQIGKVIPQEIINYRKTEPFYTKEDVKAIFVKQNQLKLYLQLEPYLILE